MFFHYLEFLIEPEDQLVEVNEYVRLECVLRNAGDSQIIQWYKVNQEGNKEKINPGQR